MTCRVLSLLSVLGIAAIPVFGDQAYLGLETRSLRAEFQAGRKYEVPIEDGLVVTKVVLDSPAEEAGISKNDVLVSINREQMHLPEQLYGFLAETPDTEKLRIVYYAYEPVEKRVNKKRKIVWEYTRKKALIKQPKKQDYLRKLDEARSNPVVYDYIEIAVENYRKELRELLSKRDRASAKEMKKLDREIRVFRKRGPQPACFDGIHFEPLGSPRIMQQRKIGYIDTDLTQVVSTTGQGEILARLNRPGMYSSHKPIYLSIDSTNGVDSKQYMPLPKLPLMQVVGWEERSIAGENSKKVYLLKPFDLEPVRHLIPESMLR